MSTAMHKRMAGLSLIELMRDDVPRTRPVMGTAMRAGKREMQQRILEFILAVAASP